MVSGKTTVMQSDVAHAISVSENTSSVTHFLSLYKYGQMPLCTDQGDDLCIGHVNLRACF